MYPSTLPSFNGAPPGDIEHRSALMKNIKIGLVNAVVTGDVAAAIMWTRKANVFLTLRYVPDDSDRGFLVKLLVGLVSEPNIDMHLAHTFASTAVRLAKKDKLLTPDMLEIDWKPLWELIRRASFPRGRERVFNADASYAQEILKLVRTVRRLFPVTATFEILEEFMPDINPHNISHFLNIVGHMTVFLPTNRPPKTPSSISPDAPAFFWVPTLFSIWSLATGAHHLDKSILSVLARLAEDQNGSPELCGWTDDMMKVVFECGLRDLEMPVGSASAKSGGRGKANLQLIPYFARFIVNTIYPVQVDAIDGYIPPTNSLSLLQTLLQAAETYFHPSNYGPWSLKLASLLHHLCVGFLKRSRKEMDPDCKTPQRLRLTKELRDTFVDAIQACAFLSMFAKDPRAVNEANGAIKALAYLNPGVVLPKVLERVFPALETLTETHRTSACLSNLGLTILPILNRNLFPPGAKNFVELLNLSLPGIDMNDPMKTTSTLVFISSAFMGVPIADLSNSMVDDENEDDREVRLSTAGLEEWLILFLNRIYLMFENLPQIHGSSNENNMENVLLSMATYALQIIFQQTSSSIHEVALKSLAKFVSTTVIPSATKAVGKILSIAGGSFPSKKLHHFLQLTSSRIREELASHASSKPSLPKTSFPFSFASLSDAALHWHQYAFLCTLSNTGDSLLVHQKLVSIVIEEMILGCKSYRGIKWAAKSIHVAIMNCISVYPKELRSFEGVRWDDSSFMSSSYQYWGEQQQIAGVAVDWHIPTGPELEFAMGLLSKYAKLTMLNLEKLLEVSQSTPVSASDLRRDQSFEFTRWVMILRSLILSIGGLLPPWDDNLNSPVSETPLMDLSCPMEKSEVHPSCGYLLQNSPHYTTASQIRHKIGELLNQLMVHFESQREDDVEPLKQLIKAVTSFVSFRGVKASTLAKQISGYKYIKGIVGSVENGKRLPRYLHVKRSHILHQHRLRFCFSHESVLTIQTEEILTSLFNLSLSRYSAVRIEAQSALNQTMVPFEALKKKFYKSYLNKLAADGTPEHVIKGCLHVCNSPMVGELARRDVECCFLFVQRICLPFGDKPSIQELVRNIFVSYLENMCQLSIGLSASPSLVESIRKYVVVDQATLLNGIMTSRNEAKNLMELYSKFLVDMVALIENPSTHWRARAMAVNLLEVVWRPQDVQPTILTRVLLEGVISPHPTLRDVTISLLARVLRSLKARAKTAGTDRTKVCRREVIRTSGDVVDTDTYLKNSVVSGATNIHDSSIVGWYCWPTKEKFYTLVGSEFDVGGDTLESLPYYDKESRESLELLSLTINQASFWEKLSLYHSQESSKGAEAFNSDLFNLVRVLAGQFEDSFVGHLKHAVVELVKDPKDKSKQRAAAEFLAGLVRGSKNWSIPKTEKLWGWVMPILETAFQTSSTETVRFWIDFLNAVLVNRDPRRVLPIIQFVFNWKLDPVAQSFFTEAKKLTLIKIVVSCFKWRLLPLYPPLLAELVSQIRHPYQQVRDVLGVVIDMIMQLLWHPSANSIEEIIQWSIFSGGSLHPDIYSANSFNGVVPVVLHESVKLLVENLFIDMKKWRAIERVNKIGPSDYGNASKTVIAWILGSMAWNATTAKFTCFHLQIPELFKMIDYDDLELQKKAAGIATMYSNLPFPLQFLPQVLDRILALLADPDLKWQVKLKLIPCLQILFFKNLLFLTSEMKVVILDTVSTLLLHPQVEIRNLAGVTLSGLVLCSERASISVLKTKFEGSLKASKSAKKKTTLPPNPSTSPTTGSLHPLVLQRHASVIGLSSLILAFPYDVPSWMPAVLITLSSCISDQAPIGETVAKTFADFRRTHQDNWKEEGSKAFTEDQLSILSDLLISSSYYA